jgi:hypothetical protein
MLVVELVILAVVSCSPPERIVDPAVSKGCHKIVHLEGYAPRIQPSYSVCLSRSKFVYANPPFPGVIVFCQTRESSRDGPKEKREDL